MITMIIDDKNAPHHINDDKAQLRGPQSTPLIYMMVTDFDVSVLTLRFPGFLQFFDGIETHCSHVGPHLGTLVPMGTKMSFLVPI